MVFNLLRQDNCKKKSALHYEEQIPLPGKRFVTGGLPDL